MKDFSTLQLLVGTVSVMFLIVSATFAGYWNFIGKKNRSLSSRENLRPGTEFRSNIAGKMVSWVSLHQRINLL